MQTVQAMSVLGLPGPGAQFISDSMRANQAMQAKELLESWPKVPTHPNSPSGAQTASASSCSQGGRHRRAKRCSSARAVARGAGADGRNRGNWARWCPTVMAQRGADADSGPWPFPPTCSRPNWPRPTLARRCSPHIKFTPTGFTVPRAKFQTDAPKMAEQAAAGSKQQADTKAVRKRQCARSRRRSATASGYRQVRQAERQRGGENCYSAFVSLQLPAPR